MYLLLSGEGATDFGISKADLGDRLYSLDEWDMGPMVYFVNSEFTNTLGYSAIDAKSIFFLPKILLKKISKEITGLTAAPPNQAFYVRNAQALTAAAYYLQDRCETPVLSIFFRDTDGTQERPTTRHESLTHSIKHPFKDMELPVCPMVPKPKSEVWLLCALQNHYQHCEALENISGNDASPNSAKAQLKRCIPEPNRVTINAHIQSGKIAYEQIVMPSLTSFRNDFARAYAAVEKLRDIPSSLAQKLLNAAKPHLRTTTLPH